MAEYEGTEDLRDHEDGWTTLCGVDVIKWKPGAIGFNLSSATNPSYLFCLINSLTLKRNIIHIAGQWHNGEN